MPQVPGAPYEPYPTVAPAERVLRPGGVPEVPAAYGVGVANAISAFGGDVEKAGKEVFNTALDVRKKRLETVSRDATNDFYNNGVAPTETSFLSARGGGASTDAMHQSLTTLDADRRARRDQLEKEYGIYTATLFDADTASMMRQTQQKLALHSIAESQRAANASRAASDAATLDMIGNAPNDEVFNRYITKDASGQSPVARRAMEDAREQGFDNDWAARREGELTSKAVVAHINSRARVGDYQGARAIYSAYDKQILGEEDRSKAEAVVNGSENKFLGHDIARATAQGFPPYMTQQEIARSNGVSPPLIAIIQRAQANHPDLEMTIGDKGGRRTVEEQARLVAAGRSQTMQSGHLDGTAVDVVGRVNGRPVYDDPALQKKVDSAMREAADQLGVDLRPQISWDKYHFQLGKDYNVAGFTRPPLPSLEEQREKNVSYAQNVSPNNPSLQDAVVDRTDQQWRIRRQSEQAQFDDAKQTFENNLAAGQYQTAADVPPELVRQLQTSNAAGAAYAAGLDKKVRQHWDNDDSWTPAREVNENMVMGMLRSPDETLRAKAARMDLHDFDLQSSVRKELTKLQGAIIGGRAPDPTNLAGVMRTLDPFLLANNLDRMSPDVNTQNKYLAVQGMIYRKLEDMVAAGQEIPRNPAQIEQMFLPIIRSQSLVQDLRAATPTVTPAQVGFTGRTASAPGKPMLRETTDGRWVP